MYGAGLSLLKNTHLAETSTSELGAEGERLAAEYLSRRGFDLVCRNFRAPVGRNRSGARITGEIDLVAMDGDTVCFIEVKTRSGPAFGGPLSAVDVRKQRQISRVARIYRKIFGLEGAHFRYDAVGVSLLPGKKPDIEHRKAFWDESVFRKKRWAGEG
ncbi:MAG: YraN family protein [Acidobacteriota bacterium]|nr:MAG: YraN family protein [Acidobacteriota bacterium]